MREAVGATVFVAVGVALLALVISSGIACENRVHRAALKAMSPARFAVGDVVEHKLNGTKLLVTGVVPCTGTNTYWYWVTDGDQTHWDDSVEDYELR